MKKLIFLLILLLIVISCFSQEKFPNSKISGIIFGDYFYNISRDTGIVNFKNTALKGNKNINGLSLKRIYFTYDYSFSSKLNSRFRIETDENVFTINAENKLYRLSAFVKDAYIRWFFFINHSLIIGIQPTPALEISELAWGNRFLERTIMDLRGIVSSRDLALSLKGQFDSTGILKYTLMYGNNSAYKPENDIFKRLYLNFEINLLKNFLISLYTDLQSKEKIKNKYNSNALVNNNVLINSILLSYKFDDKFSIGLESFHLIEKNGFDNNSMLKNRNSFGISIFNTVNLTKNILAVGRFDYFDPNYDRDANADIRYIILGSINYKISDNFVIAPNIYFENYENLPNRKITNSISARISFNWKF